MSDRSTLTALFRYQAWANAAFLEKLDVLDAAAHPAVHDEARRLLDHCLVVNRIFRAHLAGTAHGFAADQSPDRPTLQALRTELTATDRWFLDYAVTADAQQLAEPIAFRFTDGDEGRMTREEMLLHVVTHGGYHRGEIGRLLKQAGAALPWDTFAVHLHQVEPGRRLRA